MTHPLRLLSLWRALAGARVRAELSYRTSFVLMVIAQLLSNAVDLVAVWAIFHTTDSLGGWQASQVVWMAAVTTVAFGLADVFVSQVEDVADHIRTGRFDTFSCDRRARCCRSSPTDSSCAGSAASHRAFACLVLMPVRPDWFGIERSVRDLGLTLLCIVLGTLVYAPLFVLTNSISFWLVDAREVANSFTYGGHAASKYPLDVLAVWVRRMFIWIVPVGFVAWLPGTRVLRDAPAPRELPSWIAWCSPLAAALLIAFAAVVWRAAIRHYESTGS